MTAISWTEPASADFLGIVEWIEERNPTAAIRVGRRILDAAELLADHPSLGKPGRSPDTRELGVPGFRYLMVYGVEPGAMASDASQVAILRVLHGAMMWPSQGADSP